MKLERLARRTFGARIADYFWFVLLIEIIFSPFGWNEGLVIWLGWLLFVPVEAFLTYKYGCTPGKLLLGLKVRQESGTGISFRINLKRSFEVWVFGLWMCVFILPIFACLLAYRDLTENGSTSWDRRTGLTVQ